ncbi:HPr family phosphocarrier protein [Clostridia bacterium]|nr:HPr family phosphocarrier protein [Clostridia bacterium]
MEIMSIKVENETGLHARPAAEFVKLASEQACEVFVEKDEKRVSAKSILGILTLAITKGTVINIITDGENEKESMETLLNYIRNVI